jgi:SsrA-binding protein
MKIFAINKRAGFDYEILEKYEAGLMLKGFEVKAVKTGHISLKGSFVTIHGNELFLTNANIPLQPFSQGIKDYDPSRSRKLLVKKSEIKYLRGKSDIKGLTLVPIKVYTKNRLLKLEFGLGKGKKEYDKRDKIQKREDERRMRRVLKNVRG